MKLRLSFLLCACVLAMPYAGRVQAADREAARAHFERGTRLYDINRFDDALKEYEAAYLELADPIFLFNIGQCYRQMGKLELAVKTYRSYLRNKPDAPNAADVKRRIDELEAELKGVAPAAVPAVRPVTPLSGPVTVAPPGPVTVQPVQDRMVRPPAVVPPPVVMAAEDPAGPGEVPSISEPAARAADGDGAPLYTRWWFWGGVGLVAVGAAVAVILLSAGGSQKQVCPMGDICL